MPEAQSVWRFLGRVWRIVRQRRSLAWAASISTIALIISCTLGAHALSTSVAPLQFSYQSHAGVAFLTPTPSATPSATPTAIPSAKPSATPQRSSNPCPPVPGYEDSTDEANLLVLVNQARASNGGIAPLSVDPLIHGEALVHSADMSCYGMSHYIPPGTTPASRMTAAGVQFNWYGENIGWAGSGTNWQKVQWLFNSMMAEQPPNDGHRQNILSPNFTRTGIGIYVENVSGKLWLTEDFAG